MATPQEIRRRIKSVKNISQVTRAMEAVSASKMRRAAVQVVATRPYARKAWEVAGFLARQAQAGPAPHSLLEQRPVEKIALVLVTPDKGLAGGMIANIIRTAATFRRNQTSPVSLITVGRKGRDFFARYGGGIVAEFGKLGDTPSLLKTTPISKLAIDAFLSREFDAVYLAYTDFVNVMQQRPVVRQILPVIPVDPEAVGAAKFYPSYIYEPDEETLLAALMPRLIELQVYQAVLESLASEHSARMVAMRNATGNAKELVTDLTLTLNKVRQATITRDMLDIAGGVEALKQAGQKKF
ncbi:MAG: ATP synthase F1 subunit gamma [Chloroflexi bacterium]|nr:ATP synthase F1 subunit gamma [Chloroflexota bacterium]